MIEDWCHILRPHWKTKIEDLNGNERNSFENVKKLIINIYHKKDEYKSIFNTIRHIFEDLIKNENIEAGTVSGYIAGCMIEERNGMQTCGVICAQNSIPNPMLENTMIIGCHYNVIKANENIHLKKFTFEKIYNNEETKDSILYIPTTCENFYLDQTEKLYLKQNLKVERIHLLRYSFSSENGMENNIKYEDVWTGFRPIDDIESPPDIDTIVNVENESFLGKYIWFIVIIIVLLFSIIIGSLLWYKRR